jgi:hypothetical protein
MIILARQQKRSLRGVQGLEIVEPGDLGHGQYYPSYCQEWMEWLVSNNPESNNDGPIYFLHCVSPQENSRYGNSTYNTEPVVRIGIQSISINPGNYVFLPIITAAAETIDTGVPDTPAALLNYVRTDLEGGDSPPDRTQATIVDATNIDPAKNDKIPMVPIIDDGLDRFLVITNVFPLDVPPAQPGARLLRNSFDIPINTPGVRNCRVGGYWILMRFNNAGKRYFISSFAKGRSQYRAGMLYEIEVSTFEKPRRTNDQIMKDNKMTNHQIKRVVEKLSEDGQIDQDYKKIIERILRD